MQIKAQRQESKRIKEFQEWDVNGVKALSDPKSNSTSNLIYIGGNYLGRPAYSDSRQVPLKTFKQLREEMAETMLSLQEKKSERKGKSKPPGAEPMNDRSVKIRDLKKRITERRT